MRVMDLADELGVSTVAVVAAAEHLGIDARWAGAELADADVARLRRADLTSAAIVPTVPTGPAHLTPMPGFTGAPALVDPRPPEPAVQGEGDPRPARSPLGRRPDAMVRKAWEQWWRSIFIAVVTTVTVGFLAALLKGFANVADAYDYTDSGAPLGKVSLLVFLFLAGMAWATLVNVRGAATALDAWNRIIDSDRRLKGRIAITWFTFSAVCSCLALLTSLVAGVALVIAVA